MWYILWSEGLVMVQNLLDAEEYIWFEILSLFNQVSIQLYVCGLRGVFW